MLVVRRASSVSCYKCIFDQTKANLAEIQPQNHQNVQKNAVLAKLRKYEKNGAWKTNLLLDGFAGFRTS